MISERENQIIGRIYDCALQPALWNSVLAEIADLTGSETAIFTALDQLSPNYDFAFNHNLPQEGLLAYQDKKIQMIDMRLHAHLWENIGIGETHYLDCRYYAHQPQNSDEFVFYERCLKPADIGYIGAVLLEAGKYRWAVLGLHRKQNTQNYGLHELEILKRLGTHLRRALQIHRQMVSIKQENHNLYTILDYFNTGVMLLDQDSCLFYANQHAKQYLESSTLLSIDENNQLKTRNIVYQAKLEKLVLSALLHHPVNHDISQERGGVLALNDEETAQQLMLSIVPFSKLSRFEMTSQQKEIIAVFMTDPNKSKYLAVDYLIQTYQLTKRELEICQLFLNGLNLEQIAEYCEITLGSLRTYLKRIFAKTHANSQTELMRILTGATICFEHIQ